MMSFSIARTAKTVTRLGGCAALLALLGAADCEGEGFVETNDVRPGKCVLQNPITNPKPAAGSVNDVLQLTDLNDAGNFIRCRLTAEFNSGESVNIIIFVSPEDARGHSFVDSGQPASILNLSRAP